MKTRHLLHTKCQLMGTFSILIYSLLNTLYSWKLVSQPTTWGNFSCQIQLLTPNQTLFIYLFYKMTDGNFQLLFMQQNSLCISGIRVISCHRFLRGIHISGIMDIGLFIDTCSDRNTLFITCYLPMGSEHEFCPINKG